MDPTPIDLPRQIKLARRAREQQQIHETKAADAAVTLAEALTSARALCPPAAWPAVLANLELSEDVARDLLAIHRLALAGAAIVDLGGLTLAGLWASRQRLPGPDEVVTICSGPWDPARPTPIVYIWQAEDGHCVGRLDFHGATGGEVLTRHPVTDERMVWSCAWILIEFEYSDICTGLLTGEDAQVVLASLRTQRDAMGISPSPA